MGVVLCYPLGYEGICAHRAFRDLAIRLASEGFPTLRFDYAGTGDALGDETSPDRASAWRRSVVEAVAELRRRGGVERVALAGTRQGALLACVAASDLGGVEALALWAPVVSGRAWAREVRAFAAVRRESDVVGPGDVNLAGFLLTASTLEALSELDLSALESAPARRVLVVSRDDVPAPAAETHFVSRLASLGVAVEQRCIPGYAAMMVHPHETRAPDAVWTEIVRWLGEGVPRDIQPTPPQREAAILDLVGAREEALRFGGEDRLFGMLGTPAAGPPPETAILLLTVAAQHRIGPNRIYLRWARSLAAEGYATLRFDVSGTGDSLVNETGLENIPYALDHVADVQAAISLLEGRGVRRFVLVGMCSGSYLAYHAALSDARVSGMVLINPRTFDWKPGDRISSPNLPTAAKSTRFYWRMLFAGETWRRLWSREIEIGVVTSTLVRRAGALAFEFAREGLVRIVGAERAANPVRRAFERLTARGMDALLVFGADDAGIDLIERYLGARGGRMRHRDNFTFRVVEGGAEHTFGQRWAQAALDDLVLGHLRGRFPVLR
jgi:pimeloyl-ACP methyl ester carboxylesterase